MYQTEVAADLQQREDITDNRQQEASPYLIETLNLVPVPCNSTKYHLDGARELQAIMHALYQLSAQSAPPAQFFAQRAQRLQSDASKLH